MGWVRLSDDFYDHDRFADVGPLGIAVWVVGLAYCNRNLTDGRIPKRSANRLIHVDNLGIYTGPMAGKDAEVADGIDELLDAGLWVEDGKHYLIRDYLDYQPSRDDVEDQRQKNAWRQAQFKKRKRAETAGQDG